MWPCSRGGWARCRASLLEVDQAWPCNPDYPSCTRRIPVGLISRSVPASAGREGLGGRLVPGREDVAVDAEHDRGVEAEATDYQARVDARGDQLGGREVAQVVEADRWHVLPVAQGGEGTGDAVGTPGFLMVGPLGPDGAFVGELDTEDVASSFGPLPLFQLVERGAYQGVVVVPGGGVASPPGAAAFARQAGVELVEVQPGQPADVFGADRVGGDVRRPAPGLQQRLGHPAPDLLVPEVLVEKVADRAAAGRLPSSISVAILAASTSTALGYPTAPGRRGAVRTVRDSCPYLPVVGSRRPVETVISTRRGLAPVSLARGQPYSWERQFGMLFGMT